MAIFRFFKKKNKEPIVLRCTHCDYELDYSPREMLVLKKLSPDDTVCPFKVECDICHLGFMIPVNYTDKYGKRYLFHEIKPKIKSLDPNTVMERIFEHADPENIKFFGPDELKDDLDS